GTPAIAAALGKGPVAAPFKVGPLRGLYASLGDARFMMAGRASQIVEWGDTHRFCGRCATPMQRIPNQRCMRCPKCDFLGYPRIAPAVIVLVRRGDEALLVGYFAEWAGGDIRPDGSEILDARWFRVTELPAIPPRVSIARRLIDAWIADVAQSP